MVYQHTCVHEIETQGKERELKQVSLHGVCAFAAGDQKGRPIRLTGSRCELHFSFSSAPATATSITNRTNEIFILICRNDCNLFLFFFPK